MLSTSHVIYIQSKAKWHGNKAISDNYLLTTSVAILAKKLVRKNFNTLIIIGVRFSVGTDHLVYMYKRIHGITTPPV